MFNPIAAGLVVASRLVGGQILSFFAFFQHGLIDPNDVTTCTAIRSTIRGTSTGTSARTSMWSTT